MLSLSTCTQKKKIGGRGVEGGGGGIGFNLRKMTSNQILVVVRVTS